MLMRMVMMRMVVVVIMMMVMMMMVMTTTTMHERKCTKKRPYPHTVLKPPRGRGRRLSDYRIGLGRSP